MSSSPLITPYSMLLALGAAQGAFLAVAIVIARRGDRAANRYLSALVMTFVVDLVDEFALASGYFARVPELTAINWAVDLLFGPLIYLYTRHLTDPGTGSGNQGLPVFAHLGPFVSMLVVVLIATIFLPPWQFHLQVGGGGHIALRIVEGIAIVGGFVSMATYLLLSLRRLRVHRREIGNRFSYVERVSLQWLRLILLTMLVLFLLYVLSAIIELSTPIRDFENRSLYPAIVLSIYAMGFLGLLQPRLFDRKHEESSDDSSKSASSDRTSSHAGGTTRKRVSNAQPKYRNSPISAEQSACILQEIEAIMGAEKLFLNASLSLPKLAERLRLSPNVVSQAINEAGQISFFDFVNGYRVSEAKRMLQKSNDTVLTVALASGFNSKSAFYKAFAKHIGLTPGQYRQSQRSDDVGTQHARKRASDKRGPYDPAGRDASHASPTQSVPGTLSSGHRPDSH